MSVLYVWQLLARSVAVLVITFGLCLCVWLSGCAAGTTVAGVAMAAKPILDTSCMVARRACDLVTRGCDLVSPEPAHLDVIPPGESTAGGEVTP